MGTHGLTKDTSWAGMGSYGQLGFCQTVYSKHYHLEPMNES